MLIHGQWQSRWNSGGMGNDQSSRSQENYSSNIYELVIKASKDLETFLEVEFGATGRGLHEKISSVEGSLTPALVKRMRYLATVRNKLIHSEQIPNPPTKAEYIRAYQESKDELAIILRNRNSAAVRTTTVRTQGGECIIL